MRASVVGTWGVIGLLLLASSGCGGDATASVDEFELTIKEEPTFELPLGNFVIPIPVPTSMIDDGLGVRNRMQMEFTLVAEIDEEYEQRAHESAERNAGRIRDRVIAVCRSTPIDELNDHTLTALKSHLIDITQPLLDGVPIRQIGVVDRQTKPL